MELIATGWLHLYVFLESFLLFLLNVRLGIFEAQYLLRVETVTDLAGWCLGSLLSRLLGIFRLLNKIRDRVCLSRALSSYLSLLGCFHSCLVQGLFQINN